MNVVNLIGRWVRDHDISTVGQQGTTLVKNTIAVDHPFKKDSPSFLRVVMWGKTGELANDYTGKGSQIGIEGHLETGSYEDKDGKKIFTVDVVASRVKFLDSKKESSNQSNGGQAPSNTNTPNQQPSTQNRQENTSSGTNNQYQQPQSNNPHLVDDDSLPF